jgi:hypothetical protein
MKRLFTLLICLNINNLPGVSAFTSFQNRCRQPSLLNRKNNIDSRSSLAIFNEGINSSSNESETKTIGDPLRDTNGIRPSLHPVTINALAIALKVKASHLQGDQSLTVSDKVTPLDVAIRAGKIAMNAIDQRQSKSDRDGMKLTPDETQTIAGRVVGVMMRVEQLEATLLEKVKATSWIAQFGDWDTFGVLPDESDAALVRQRIQDDPLFTMTRAECLLGIFLASVEKPQLQKAGQSVPDQSQTDFLDEDRTKVLL